jgi:hypothetical protein
MACCRIYFGFVDAGLEEVLADSGCTGLHVGPVLAAGADGWDAKEVEQFGEETVFMLILIGLPGGHT